jgi:hypothetical protein
MDLIANKVMRHPLMKSLNYEDVIDYSLSVLKLVKVPGIYKEHPHFAILENHLAFIPKEALNLKKVEFVLADGTTIPMTESTNSLGKQPQLLEMRNAYARTSADNAVFNNELITDPSVSSVKMNGMKTENTVKNSTETFKYKVNNQHVQCSVKNGGVLMIYDRINADKDGIPLVPNSEALIKAIVNYIKVQVFEVLVDLNKLSERSLTRAEQEYSWYIGAAQTEFQGISSEDEMEAFINSHVGLFNISSLHSDRYEHSSDKEVINIL